MKRAGCDNSESSALIFPRKNAADRGNKDGESAKIMATSPSMSPFRVPGHPGDPGPASESEGDYHSDAGGGPARRDRTSNLKLET